MTIINPSFGMYFLNTDDNIVYQFDGVSWVGRPDTGRPPKTPMFRPSGGGGGGGVFGMPPGVSAFPPGTFSPPSQPGPGSQAPGGGSAAILVTLPTWNFTNPGVAGNPALTTGLGSPPGPNLSYHITVRRSGVVVATYLWQTATNASTLGDGTGLDNFGAQGPIILFAGGTYEFYCVVASSDGNPGYTTGLTNFFNINSDWPAGLTATQVPVPAIGPAAFDTPFLIGRSVVHF